MIVEKGFAATRTEDIAERAGVSKGTLYLCFDSKKSLLTELIKNASSAGSPSRAAKGWMQGLVRKCFAAS